MKRFQINETELKFIIEMVDYLNSSEGNLMSEDGSKQFRNVIDRVSSRPVVDIIIDTEAVKESLKQQEINND